MIEAIFEARREKIRNKTREKERERLGEFTRNAIRRGRKGPPAHVLAIMSPERRQMDRVARSPSEVGYVALVKRKLGRKLKDPEAGLELGEKELRPVLDKARNMIREENRKRKEEEDISIQTEEQPTNRESRCIGDIAKSEIERDQKLA